MNLHQFAETHEVTNQPPPLDGPGALVPTGRSRGSMRTARWPVGR